MQTHASVPIAEHIENDMFNVYFSSRDSQNRSFTGRITIDINHPQRIMDIAKNPVISPGALGAFDDSGAMATWLTSFNGKRYLYYVGWNLGVTVPFRNSIGVAIAPKNMETSFLKPFFGPILDRSMAEPHFCGSCCVIPGEDCWRMWYLSCTGWSLTNGKPEHRYHLKYAESKDGVNWLRYGAVAIDYIDQHEYAISRPSVVRDSDVWRMWFSSRGDSYRIRYAESDDGKNWRRHDSRVGIDTSVKGWDSEMIEYPFVFDHKGQRYMLYNGNGYGKSGFGLAVFRS